MVEIYNIAVSDHERYAHDQQMVEQFRKQYHLPLTGDRFIAGQTKILDLVPKHPAIVLLMQTYRRTTWARFRVPPRFYSQRFDSPYVAPSLGPSEKQDSDIRRVHAVMRQNGEEQEDPEEAILTNLLTTVRNTNEMIDEVRYRMKQFVQG